MSNALAGAPDWYRDAIIYELHVRSFLDSNSDGSGDFNGLTQKLDYLQQLGVTALWLLPFYPSPLRDDGYDIADFEDVHHAYGDLAAFRRFLREAHQRGLRVITELVLNHTSDMHPWFQRARRAAPGSRWRDFYVWSDTPTRYPEARIIFGDFETSNWTWDIEAQAYYFHRFYSHQPDLNFDNPEVRKVVTRVLDRWLGMGVDGLRLDAVPYLYERDGTNCENLPETHAFLRELRAHIDKRFPNRLLLAEANQWPEDAVAYFGDGDECHMAFHFPLMPRLFMALQMESRVPVVDILEQTPAIPSGCQWAMFLRNHDELTLEMVTDEERDYMYRRYAADPQERINLGIRRRLAPLLQNDRRKIELLSALLFSLPGTPVIYYGDELGMGDNVFLGDRNGVRTPMQWNSDRNAGFSRANPQQLYLPVIIDPEHHYESINVEAQHRSPSSLWWWMHRMIALRKRHAVFARGSFAFVEADNVKVLSFVRSPADPEDGFETVLVVANLSRYAQQASIDLRRFGPVEIVEMFGQTPFVTPHEHPYVLSLAPYSFYWLLLKTRDRVTDQGSLDGPPRIDIAGGDLLTDRHRPALELALRRYIGQQRWYGGKKRSIQEVRVDDVIPLRIGGRRPRQCLFLIHVEFADAEPETYVVPVSTVNVDAAQDDTTIALLNTHHGLKRFVAGVDDEQLNHAIFEIMRRGLTVAGGHGRIVGRPTKMGRTLNIRTTDHPARAINAEQSNTSVVFGDVAITKLIRRIETGINPDAELSRHLTDNGYLHTPQFLGSIEYETHGAPPATLLLASSFVPNEGDEWKTTLDEMARILESSVLRTPVSGDWPTLLLGSDHHEAPPAWLNKSATHLFARAQLLGDRTADLHHALSDSTEPDFRPEPFTRLYQRSLYQALRGETRETMHRLRRASLSGVALDLAHEIFAGEDVIMHDFTRLASELMEVSRIRIHGDLHLGQVLASGNDVTFIDFEGEPARPLGERRIKRSALRDVAGVVRSYDYAARQALQETVGRGVIKDGHEHDYATHATLLGAWAGRAYWAGYRQRADDSVFLPRSMGHTELLLEVYVLQKAMYEVRYELDRRPDWVEVPLAALARMVNEIRMRSAS
ncbi:MAG TPA: maltose alpha-D-glucosyltransferase [Acidimicrobiales bacterium]|nr:maltose alpha-D-glucosyltransferase [Acidimicrobiales bacterium]